MNKELLFTGFYSCLGEKIYLGDKIRHFINTPVSSTFVVQYDHRENEFYMILTGRNSGKVVYRRYPLKGNLDSQHSQYHVVGNAVCYQLPKVGENVKITVNNRGEFFPFGSFVTVLKVEEWNIEVKSLVKDEIISLSFGEFMEIRN